MYAITLYTRFIIVLSMRICRDSDNKMNNNDKFHETEKILKIN